MDTKISVIVPAYNIEAYLGRCLDSLLSQSYQKLEIIVVNDGSQDGTGQIVDKYAARDGRIKGIHQENGGVTAARLRGVSEATGQWIGFADGDDYVEPEMYARLLNNAIKYDAQISHCGYKMVYPHGKVDSYYDTGKLVIQKGKQGCADLLEGTLVEPGLCNKLFKRELFDGLESWLDKSVKIYEDLLMNFYLFRRIQLGVFEDFCPYHYMLRSGSTMVSVLNANKLRDPIKVSHILEKETAGDLDWQMPVERRLMYQLV